MVQENGIPGDEEKLGASPVADNSLYQSMSAVAPERDLVLDDDEGVIDELGGHRTLGERIAESPNLSDTQTIVKEMFPRSGHKHIDDMQVSRIFPDTYNPLTRLLVKSMLQEAEGDLSVAEAIAIVNTSMSIGIDGEARIELVALAGAAKDTEIDKEKKALGL